MLNNEDEFSNEMMGEDTSMFSIGGDGSSDPLLQIPSQLSAVLTLRRGSPGHQLKAASADAKIRTPLLKRKRESIV